MITPSNNNKIKLQSSTFCLHNYNKSATIPKCGATLSSSSLRHHTHHHQSKEATHKMAMQLQKRTSMIAGSSETSSSVCSRRAAIQHKNRRSFRYTRTLDIILEEQQSSEQQQPQRLCRSSCCEMHDDDDESPTILATDFWHSTRFLKKSATSVSLDSLVTDSSDGTNSGEPLSPNNNITTIEDHDDDYDHFLVGWEL